MLPLPIGQLAVNLVRQHHNFGSPQHLGDFLQMLAAHHAPRRVVGERQHQHFGPGRDSRPQRGGRQTEPILRPGDDRHRHSSRHAGQRLIADEARLGDQHLVPRIQQGAKSQVDGLAASHRHQDFVLGRICNAAVPLHIGGNRLPQLHQPGVGAVPGFPRLQGADPFLPDVPGRRKIRLSDGQGNHVLHLVGYVKKAADPGGLEHPQRLVEYLIVIHGFTGLLSRPFPPRGRARPFPCTGAAQNGWRWKSPNPGGTASWPQTWPRP